MCLGFRVFNVLRVFGVCVVWGFCLKVFGFQSFRIDGFGV